MTLPTPQVRKVEPRCVSCGSEDRPWEDTRHRRRRFLVQGDGPAVCHACIQAAGDMGRATIRRSDSPRRRR